MRGKGRNLKVLNLCLGSFFIENWSYQENLLAKYYKKIGNDVTVIASCFSFNDVTKEPEFIEACEYINKDGVRIRRIEYLSKKLSGIYKILRIYKSTYDSICKEKPDIIFIHGCQFLDILKVIKYKNKNPEVKIFIDNHADYINSATNWVSKNILHKIIWKYCARKIQPYTEKFYGVTPNRCTFLEEMYGIDKKNIELLVMGADDEKINLAKSTDARSIIRKQLNFKDTDFVIITGGKIDKRKNIHLLMEAINNNKNSNIRLIVFGTTNSEMADKIENLSKSKNIEYIGWIESEETYKYFSASDLAIFPGTHSVLWEQAIGSGLPCIFKKWENMTHVDVGGNCLFLKEDSIEEIENTIDQVIDNKDLYNCMKKISMEKGKEIFSYEKIARRSIGQSYDN